jgi:hypothetical protein
VLLTACTVAACGNQPLDTGVSPTSTLGNGSLAETAAIGDINNSCSNQTTFWVTPHYSTDDGYIKGEWTPVFNVDTYKVQISYSRDGIEPWRVVATFDTNRTEFRYVDGENGGRYLVRVRVKNRCDGMGPWSEALRIYIGGGADSGDALPPPPPPCGEECYVPPPPPGDDGPGDDTDGPGDDTDGPGDDDDGNNGHGNDDDHDDDSNPGGGGGIN